MNRRRKFQDVNDVVAVVTGGSAGIGRALSKAIIDRGGTVYALARSESDVAETAAEIGAHPVVCDVRDVAGMRDVAARIEREQGRVDIVVNNAGVGPLDRFDGLTIEDFAWAFDINFTGVLNGIKAFLPLLRRNPAGGAIVNTVSVGAYVWGVGSAAYGASKAAVVALTESLEAELESDKSKIGTMLLVPGPVRTAINEHAAARPGVTETSPSASDFLPPVRQIEPEEVAKLVLTALARGDHYVYTHPETWPIYELAYAKMREAHGVADG